jgi:hypothetical protein
VRSGHLATSKSYRFPLPVNIGELQATDLSGANAVDGEQHQNCVIADGDRAIAGRGVYDFLHNIPSRSGGKRLVLEHARCHDRGRDTDRAPTSHFGVSKE